MGSQSSVVVSGVIPDFAIDPFREAIAYETLMAAKGITEAMLEKEFPSANCSDDQPSLVSILDSKRQNGYRQQIDDIYQQVEKYMQAILDFSVCTRGDFHYKPGLADARNPLRLFYFRGDINLLDSPCVSVVGARDASPESLAMARKIANSLARSDYTLVSGLARGIDTAALDAAISSDGRVIAVIGTPINQYYPPENKALQDKIARDYLLISQVPFYNYSKISFSERRAYFPKRNITMSAISVATIIVDASESSGTLYQARAAIRQKRPLFIAGSCFKGQSWPERFVQQGAIRFDSIDDVIRQINLIKKINLA